jgi:hypothetical protein
MPKDSIRKILDGRASRTPRFGAYWGILKTLSGVSCLRVFPTRSRWTRCRDGQHHKSMNHPLIAPTESAPVGEENIA